MNDELLGGVDLQAPLPPLPPALDAELRTLAPVAPRRPLRQLAWVVAASVGWAVAMVGLLTVRRDLGELPVPWLVAYGAAWLGGFAVPLALVVIPRRGEMTPRWRAAGAVATVAVIGLIVTGLTLAQSGPSSLHRGLSAWAGCLSTGVATAVVPIALVALALRGVAPAATLVTAVIVGAAAGAIGGLMLHAHCPIADGVHVGVVHGGVTIVAALVAGLALPRWLRAA